MTTTRDRKAKNVSSL